MRHLERWHAKQDTPKEEQQMLNCRESKPLITLHYITSMALLKYHFKDTEVVIPSEYTIY